MVIYGSHVILIFLAIIGILGEFFMVEHFVYKVFNHKKITLYIYVVN